MYPYRRKPTLREKKKAMQRWLMGTTFRIGLVVSVFGFGILYVVQTTQASTHGLHITTLEQEKLRLFQETRELEADIAEYRSMQSIQTRLAGTDFVTADNVDYIVVPDTAVAKR